MKRFAKLFAHNREWAERVIRQDPDFFQRLVSQQHPDFLWIGCFENVKDKHRECLRVLPDAQTQHDRLCELNVVEQVRNLCRIEAMQKGWARGQLIMVHGCIYDLRDGLLQDLAVNISSAEEVEPCCAEAVAKINAKSGQSESSK